MIVQIDTVEHSGSLPTILSALTRGETVTFAEPAGAAFSITKIGGSYVTRSPEGRALTSTTTFAEAWRSRPRLDQPEGTTR